MTLGCTSKLIPHSLPIHGLNIVRELVVNSLSSHDTAVLWVTLELSMLGSVSNEQ